jgi:hypothetical protein
MISLSAETAKATPFCAPTFFLARAGMTTWPLELITVKGARNDCQVGGGHSVPGRKKSSKNLDQTKFGAILDSDYNSALNHLQKGLQMLQILQLQIQLQLSVERREYTPVETLLESQ